MSIPSFDRLFTSREKLVKAVLSLFKKTETIDNIQESLNAKYEKPEGGIPASDLASDVVIGGGDDKADKVTVVDASTMPASLDPNKVYQFGTLTGSVTIPAFSSVSATDTEAKVWCMTFSTSSTAPTIIWPSAITKWSGGSSPTINASKSYEVTVMDGIGVIIEA